MLKAALIDHHDSFTWNIKAWLSTSFDVFVFDYNDITDLDITKYDLLVISPGPKTPADYSKTLQFLKQLPNSKPVLGICLGMQMMNVVENGKVAAYSPPVHGKTSVLHGLFQDSVVARYHSLKCEMSDQFETLATSNEIPMMIQHKTKKWIGFQFHPESFLTVEPEKYIRYIQSQFFNTGAQ